MVDPVRFGGFTVLLSHTLPLPKWEIRYLNKYISLRPSARIGARLGRSGGGSEASGSGFHDTSVCHSEVKTSNCLHRPVRTRTEPVKCEELQKVLSERLPTLKHPCDLEARKVWLLNPQGLS